MLASSACFAQHCSVPAGSSSFSDAPVNGKTLSSAFSAAYEALSDKEKRKIYDQYGEEGLKQHSAQQGQGGGGGFGQDIFSQ